MWAGNVDRLLNKSLTKICQLGGWGGPVGHYEKGFDTDPGPREMQLVLVLVWNTLKVSTHPVHAPTHINLSRIVTNS